MHIFGLFSGGSLTCTDCPYGFISEDDVAELLGGEVEERTFELCLHHFVLLAALALFEHFANAEDDLEAVLQSQVGLFLENFGGFAIVGAAFAVAEDDILCTRALDHGCGNLTRVGTAHFVGAVFGTQTDDIGIQFAGYGSQVNEGGADDYVAVGFVGGEHCVEFLGESYAFLQVEVHFPVTCYDFLSHWFMFFRVDNYYCKVRFIDFPPREPPPTGSFQEREWPVRFAVGAGGGAAYSGGSICCPPIYCPGP